MDGKRAEQIFMNNLANKTLRNEYMAKAQDVGSNAINLVNDFFLFGIRDDVINHKSKFPFVAHDEEMWTLTDLDRALDEMGKVK